MGGHGSNLCQGGRVQEEEDSDSDDESGSSSSVSSAERAQERSSSRSRPNFDRLWALFDQNCLTRRIRRNFTSASALKVASADASTIPPKALLVNNMGKVLDERITIDRSNTLGEGGYARVYVGKDKQTGTEYAVKCIAKSLVANEARLQREVDIMAGLDHPNICRLYETYEDHRFVYLVLELCSGGELFDRITEEGRISEQQTAEIMQQVFRAVNYMHQAKAVHRDLKPDNLLFHKEAPIEGNTLKVTDFGIATTCEPGEAGLSTKSGTLYYVAPEVISAWPRYGTPVDLWSCGVIMYVLLSGRPPFAGPDEASTLSKVMHGEFDFPRKAFTGVSDDAKQLIRDLLKMDPQVRSTAEEALAHRWIRNLGRSATSAPLPNTVIENMRSFRLQNKMKKVALNVVARQLDQNQLRSLHDVFTKLDVDGSGTLTEEELRLGLQHADITQDFINGIMQGVDRDGSGEVDYTEFLAATLDRRHYMQESACWHAFLVFDRNGDGRISQKELSTVLSRYDVEDALGKDTIETIMAEADADGDGHIDFEEFMAMMRS